MASNSCYDKTETLSVPLAISLQSLSPRGDSSLLADIEGGVPITDTKGL